MSNIQTPFQTHIIQSGEYGVVRELRYPLISIDGLPEAHPHETLIFEEGQIGEVFDLDGKYVRALVYSPQAIPLGSKVTRTNSTLMVPVGESILGTTIDPLGRQLRARDVISTRTEKRAIFTETLGINSRVTITKPFLTGLTKVDLLIPLGKGQRELVLGDAKTGKTTFLLNTLTNQVREENTIGIYCAIGKKRSEIKYFEDFFAQAKIDKNILVIATSSSDNASMIYLAPYTAMAIAEYYRDKGKNVVVVLDDLTTHAQRYREIALLSRRFPGRESYPGDIFYQHATLVERAGNFKFGLKGETSITLLPVATTVEGDITGYISTNLISMTDGHIFFDTEIYNKGERPAINIPLSVTRVGRKTQSHLVREINRDILSLLAQFRTLSQISHLDSELSAESKEVLQKGRSLMGMLDQDSGSIPHDIQIVLYGIVAGGLADLSNIPNYKKILQGLVVMYQNPAEKANIKKMIDSVKTIAEFLLQLKQKGEIIDLCKRSQTS